MKKRSTYTYTVISGDPLYTGETIEGRNLSMREAVSLWYRLRRAYLADPENNPSYAEICLEGIEPAYAGQDIVYEGSFEGDLPREAQIPGLLYQAIKQASRRACGME